MIFSKVWNRIVSWYNSSSISSAPKEFGKEIDYEGIRKESTEKLLYALDLLRETANNFGVKMKTLAPEMKKNEDDCFANAKKIRENTAKMYDINDSLAKMNEASGTIIGSLENSISKFKNAALNHSDANKFLDDTAKIFSGEKRGEEYLSMAEKSNSFPNYQGLSKQLVIAENTMKKVGALGGVCPNEVFSNHAVLKDNIMDLEWNIEEKELTNVSPSREYVERISKSIKENCRRINESLKNIKK